MMESEAKAVHNNENPEEKQFKKPILVGKIGRLPKKLSKPQPETSDDTKIDTSGDQSAETKQESAPISKIETPMPYQEPIWSGLPAGSNPGYSFEVLKNGAIIETIDLMSKPFWVFGRLPNCDISMQHPTISRYHAVLQYRSQKNDTDNGDIGFYIYDLESTHGTFLNKNRLKPRVYTRIQVDSVGLNDFTRFHPVGIFADYIDVFLDILPVGHMLKLGGSTRTFILNGPNEDTEEESTLTVTELKQLREEELKKREELQKQQQLDQQRKQEEYERELEEKGIDWGLGEDADEETDLTINPYAQTTNEDLYLDNPKKTLRGFFEREGLDLHYDCSEYGMGQFQCKIELPIDDETGRPVYAEILHKGKKKDAVVQCALEACRILDRHGLLRQSQHESHRRKRRNWEENDYYDSDDDTFLDRTGTVEKKREMRMKSKLPQQIETYETLTEKERNLQTSITNLEQQLNELQTKLNFDKNKDKDQDDSLDSFMMELKESKPDKMTINKLKTELLQLRKEHANIQRLVNLTRPTNLPPLIKQENDKITTKSKGLPIFGKRKKIKVDFVKKNPEVSTSVDRNEDDDGEEVEEDEN